ncbi:TetR/AcrR family transcriptional regulator [Salinispirillum marinum]|uniref:TetR/AcrR family transcriptional regulator n=2 Tax=Saccharospirillaceae TaxID=255527 RepID=A0ABV8BGT3_9GAMM
MLTPVFQNAQLAPTELTILNAAINLAIRMSTDHLSMTQIQKAAGVSKASLYHYFASKLDVWSGILLEEELERAQQAERLLQEGSLDAWEDYFYYLTLHPSKLAVLQQMETALRHANPDLERYRAWLQQRRQFMEVMVDAAQQRGCEAGQAQQRVAMVWATLEGWLRLHNEPDFRGLCAGKQTFAKTLAQQFAQWVWHHA